jgi:hypothetical protein
MSMPMAREKNRDSHIDNDLNNYKGIYFGGDNEQTYFESGAHFKYKELCAKLEKLVLSLTPDRRGKSMYEDWSYSVSKGIYFPFLETNSVERTKPETRKLASECSKVFSLFNQRTLRVETSQIMLAQVLGKGSE